MVIQLSNDIYELAFDSISGSLTKFVCKKSSWNLIRQPKLAQGIRLLVPTPDYRNNPVQSEDQSLSSWSKINDSTLKLHWAQLIGKRSGLLQIAVTLTISLIKDTIQFDMAIDNQSPFIVEEAWAPVLGGIREPQGEGFLASMTTDPRAGIGGTGMGHGFPQELGYWGTTYPAFMKTFPDSSNHAAFELLMNDKQGLYIGVHETTANVVNFVHELRPGYVNSYHRTIPLEDELAGEPAGYVVGVARMPFIQPGEKMVLSPVVIRWFKGDWHEGVKAYQEFRSTWHHPLPQPTWAEGIDAWVTLHMTSPENCVFYTYNDLYPLMVEAKSKGVQLLQLIGWARGGQDGDEPYQDTNPQLGTREDLKKAIKDIEDLGIRVLLMCKFKWADQATPEWKSEILPVTVKDMYGNYVQFAGYSYQTLASHLTGAARRNGGALCHLSSKFREIARREFQKIVDLGSSGILYDELVNHHMTMCFDPTHDHRYGESVMKGSIELAKEFYALGKSARPDFLMAAEGPKDLLTPYFPINYIRSWGHYYRPGWKFIDPSAKMATCLTGFDDKEMVNQCLAFGYIINYEPYNFKGTVSDITDTVNYGQKGQALRRKLWDYIWLGTFHDNVGVQMTPEDKTIQYLCTRFTHQNGTEAIVIANQSQREFKGTITLLSGKTTFDVYSIDSDSISTTQGNVVISPRSLIVLIAK